MWQLGREPGSAWQNASVQTTAIAQQLSQINSTFSIFTIYLRYLSPQFQKHPFLGGLIRVIWAQSHFRVRGVQIVIDDLGVEHDPVALLDGGDETKGVYSVQVPGGLISQMDVHGFMAGEVRIIQLTEPISDI